MFSQNFEEAAKNKFKIEENQKKIKKERKQKGIEWNPIYFKKTDEFVKEIPIYKFIE
jgi:hypothetical protein